MYVFTGPSRSGKSTCSEVLKEALEKRGKVVKRFSIDDFFSNKLEHLVTVLNLANTEYSDQAVDIAFGLWNYSIAKYKQDHDQEVIIVDTYFGDKSIVDYFYLNFCLNGSNIKVIRLMCDKDTAIERMNRANQSADTSNHRTMNTIKGHYHPLSLKKHDLFHYDLCIDTVKKTPEEIVCEVLEDKSFGQSFALNNNFSTGYCYDKGTLGSEALGSLYGITQHSLSLAKSHKINLLE